MSLTKVTYSMISGAPTCVFDYMNQGQIDAVLSRAGLVDVTVPINAALADLNAGTVRHLHFPAGVYLVTAALTTITASAWAITGDGMEVTRFLMGSTAGTNGVLFTIGDASNKPTVWAMADFDVYYNNYLTLNGTGNTLELANSAQSTVTRVKSWRGNGLATFGNTANTTLANNAHFMDCRCISYSPAGGKAINLVSFAGGNFVNCKFSASGVAATGFRGLYAFPQATDTADSMKFVSCEWNYPGSDPLYVVDYNATYNSLGNQQFVNCVFDQSAAGANIYAHIDTSPSANAKLNLYFSNCISNGATNTNTITVDNTGAKPFWVSWNGGQLTQTGNNGALLKATNITVGGVEIVGAYLSSRSPGSPVTAIDIGNGCKNITIKDCKVSADYSNSTLGTPANPFQSFVKFQGSATNIIVEGNNVNGGATSLLSWVSQPTTGLETILIRDNVGLPNNFPFKLAVTGATTSTAYTYTIAEDDVVTIKAKVMARRTSTALTTRAYYEGLVLAYRITGSSAAIQGTSYPITIESDAAMNAEWVLSGNDLQLNFTSVAGVTNDFYFDLEFDAA